MINHWGSSCSVAMRYSRYRHRQLRTTGHYFERRYRAWLIDVDSYLITCLRYIHLNPVKARIVTNPAKYAWTSHHTYLGTQTLPWLTTEFGLSLLGQTTDAARHAYQASCPNPCTPPMSDCSRTHIPKTAESSEKTVSSRPCVSHRFDARVRCTWKNSLASFARRMTSRSKS